MQKQNTGTKKNQPQEPKQRPDERGNKPGTRREMDPKTGDIERPRD